MTENFVCAKCSSPYVYEDGLLLVCPECGHSQSITADSDDDSSTLVKDAHGTVLAEGDSVTLIKDLKVKGSSSVVKVGTKVKNIRLLADATDGHNIDCKITGIGAMKLKSEFVKKA